MSLAPGAICGIKRSCGASIGTRYRGAIRMTGAGEFTNAKGSGKSAKENFSDLLILERLKYFLGVYHVWSGERKRR